MTVSSTETRPTRWSRFAPYALVLIAFASLYLITAPGRMWNTDGWTRYLVAAGLVDYGWPLLPPDNLPGSYWIVYGRDGNAYSYYGLGQSLAFVPLYAAGKLLSGVARGLVTDWSLFLASFLNSGIAALLAAAVFALACQVGYGRRTALAVAALCGLGTLVWVHSRDNFDHLLETLCLAATLACLLSALQKKSWPLMLGAGMIYGYGIVTRISILFAAPGLALLLLLGAGQLRFDLARLRLGLAFAAGALPGAVVYIGYNSLRFGTLFSTGYETKAPLWFGTPVWLGLATFLVSPGRGLLWYVPLTLALPYLARPFYRRAPGLAVSFLIITVSYLAIYSQFGGLGLWGWGPYYLLPLMPLAAIVWGEALSDWPGWSRPARWLLGSLVALSLVVQLVGVSSAWIRTYIRATAAQADLSGQVDWRPEWSLLLNQPGNTLNALVQMSRGTPLEFMTAPKSHAYQLEHDVGLNTLDWWWVLAAYRGPKAALLAPLLLAAVLFASLRAFFKYERNVPPLTGEPGQQRPHPLFIPDAGRIWVKMNDLQRARLTRWLNITALPIPYEWRTFVLDVVNRQRYSRMNLAFGDIQLDLDLADCLQSNLYLDRVWERDFSNWTAYFAARSDTLADVGAQIGYFTLLMASCNRPAAIHAFEPNPGAYRQLQRNVELNGVPARLNRVAVADGAGEAAFYLPHRFQLGSARLHRASSHPSQAITVKTVALDDYLEQHQLKGFDLIKMDIEGAEQLALRGMAAGLGKHKYGVILFELHRQLLTLDEQKAVVGTLQECGYRLFEVSGDVLKSDISAQASHLAALCPSAFERFPDLARDLTLPADFKAPFPAARV